MVDNEENTQENRSFKQMSADEVYEKTHAAAGKGVAAAAGSLQGVTDKLDEHDVAGKARQALQKTGDATRQVAGTATEEFQKTKEHVKKAGETATDK